MWDLRRGQPVFAAPLPRSLFAGSIRLYPGYALAWSPDGKTLAACDGDTDAAWLWNLSAVPQRRTVTDDDLRRTGGFRSVSWSPDGKALIAAAGKTACVLDAATGETVGRLEGNRPDNDPMTAAVWSPDQKSIATLTQGGALAFWDAQTFRRLGGVPLPGVGAGTNRLAWAPDSQRVAVGSAAGPGSVVNVADGKVESKIGGPEFALDRVVGLGWSSDGSRLLAVNGVGTMCAWDAKSWQVLWQVSGRGGSRAQHVAMSPDGLQYATAAPGGPLMIWNNRAAELTRTCGQTLLDVSDIAWSAQGLVAVGGQGGVKVWNPQTAEEPAALKLEERILSLAWLPAGDALALGSQRQSIRLWKADGKAAPTELFKAPSEVTRMAWRKDGSVLAAGLKNNDVVLFEASSGKVLKTFAATNQQSNVGVLVWLDDQRLLVTHRNVVGAAVPSGISGNIYDTTADQPAHQRTSCVARLHSRRSAPGGHMLRWLSMASSSPRTTRWPGPLPWAI